MVAQDAKIQNKYAGKLDFDHFSICRLAFRLFPTIP